MYSYSHKIYYSKMIFIPMQNLCARSQERGSHACGISTDTTGFPPHTPGATGNSAHKCSEQHAQHISPQNKKKN